MRIAGTLPCSLVNGEGIRYVVFVQGCGHHCPGCHNPETWDFTGGQEVSIYDLVKDIRRHRLIDGITLSGGDPFYQQEACEELLKLLPGMNVWIYTGFEFEEIRHTKLARMADVLVTGPYIEALRCEGKMYGSSNQEIHKKVDQMKIIEVNPDFRAAVEANDGYCPCAIEQTPDTKCMCRDFREQREPGPCHCGRFEKVVG